jgi:hypothetical protein
MTAHSWIGSRQPFTQWLRARRDLGFSMMSISPYDRKAIFDVTARPPGNVVWSSAMARPLSLMNSDTTARGEKFA